MTTALLTRFTSALNRRVAAQEGAAARSDRGATATEYALLVVFIVIAIVVGVGAFGTALSTVFDNLAAAHGVG